jgi:serine/threonine protein kinase
MQCFQKDPNLRVSARKLLKHPWIVNARRSDSVVPKKSTEYEEAVKSVQEWNEALRSPEAGTTRKLFRHDYQSSTPLPSSRSTPTKDVLPSPVSRNAADQLRSANSMEEDNWDDDFATAISPSALQLPHLRPQDNFGGMLSSEKLKAFASLDGTVLRSDGDFDEFDESFRTSLQSVDPDPLETIRPFPPKQSGFEATQQQNQPRYQINKNAVAMHNVPILTQTPVPPLRQPRPASYYKENSVEDYSDLIQANEDVLDRKLGAFQVSIAAIVTIRVMPPLTLSRKPMKTSIRWHPLPQRK